MPGTLTLVGTPIGNLSDLSPRALAALEACDFIAAEDTRVTLGLLTHFGIKKPLVSYFEHNKRERGEQIAARLLAGENAVLVTDAGMPAISDPGQDLVATSALFIQLSATKRSDQPLAFKYCFFSALEVAVGVIICFILDYI